MCSARTLADEAGVGKNLEANRLHMRRTARKRKLVRVGLWILAAGENRSVGLPIKRCVRVRANLEDVFVAATQKRKAQREGVA